MLDTIFDSLERSEYLYCEVNDCLQLTDEYSEQDIINGCAYELENTFKNLDATVYRAKGIVDLKTFSRGLAEAFYDDLLLLTPATCKFCKSHNYAIQDSDVKYSLGLSFNDYLKTNNYKIV